MQMLLVSEVFGPTFQGEGSAAGQNCLFVRLGNCNLECNWCDTPYTWAYTPEKAEKTISGKQYDKTVELRTMSPMAVVDELVKLWPIRYDPTLVVISGGEPLMQQNAGLTKLCAILDDLGCSVHIETAGTIKPHLDLGGHVDQFNVSPKLAHSGNLLSKRYKPDVLRTFNELSTAWFKFVVQHAADLVEVDKIVEECGLKRSRVMIMPEGTQPHELILTAKALADDVRLRGYGLSFRSHVFIWGDEKGR